MKSLFLIDPLNGPKYLESDAFQCEITAGCRDVFKIGLVGNLVRHLNNAIRFCYLGHIVFLFFASNYLLCLFVLGLFGLFGLLLLRLLLLLLRLLRLLLDLRFLFNRLLRLLLCVLPVRSQRYSVKRTYLFRLFLLFLLIRLIRLSWHFVIYDKKCFAIHKKIGYFHINSMSSFYHKSLTFCTT